MHPAFAVWNDSVRLSQPRAGEITARAGWDAPRRVFEHNGLLWMVGPNLLARVGSAIAPGGDPAGAVVKELNLILESTFFASAARVHTEDLPPFMMCGHRFPCSAADLQAFFHSQVPRQLLVLQGPEEVQLVWQGNERFSFRPIAGRRLASLEGTTLMSVAHVYEAQPTEAPLLISSVPSARPRR